MKLKITFLIAFLFCVQLSIGQKAVDRVFYGRIFTDTIAAENVNVLNSRTGLTTASDSKGLFHIPAKTGDALVLSAVNLETRRKIIKDEDLNSNLIILKMASKVTELNEINVNENSQINAVNLGIMPAGQKKYTPAESKLYTAQSGILDPLLNKISGRTTMLKKEVQVERNEKLLLKLDGLYEDQFYIETLKIPQIYIKGFQYYIIEDPDFVRALEAKNKTLMLFYIKKLALNYSEIISNEN
ncbi:hypothetical protein FNO01nite_01870 [Flavobacterium noncentrifugens]|uniref:CarboxypepD_reg-like domain-containing protein n=1 Tax=Flavobacterium noncentrifugens TaxID=1128970 RepID=A0A1G8RNP6_9FLAO|nr:hypothetical protein [Flavobacterium noncentrifugens]GEP49515.1 hypothetical protein FNO01nite_01870 [Flavobacterium noncentrifugens]SDJ18618.1 hypothetical protein SAMN04487935_0211 [Flavobacterium noncentrifugens]